MSKYKNKEGFKTMSENTINICDPEWNASTGTSTARVNVTAGNTSIALPDEFNEANLGVVIFGAGEEHSLATPPRPDYEIVGSSGSNRLEYRIVAITEQMGYTAAGDALVVNNAPDTIDGENYVRIIPHEVSDAYQYLIYGRNAPTGKFKFFGAIIARPWADAPTQKSREGRRRKFGRFIHFDDKPGVPVSGSRPRAGGRPLNARNVPPYVPVPNSPGRVTQYIAPEAPGRNYLQTRIVEDPPESGLLVLRDPPRTTASELLMVHDNAIVIQEAIRDATTVYIPVGNYQIYGNIVVNKPISLEGEARTSERDDQTTILTFNAGFGLEATANYTIFQNIHFSGVKKYQHSLPAGGRFVCSLTYIRGGRDREARVEAFHGCGVLVRRRGTWINCSFSRFTGTGHAIWGYPNANNTNLDRCISYKNIGHGFYAGGDADTNACTWSRCSAVGNGGWGIFDSGFLGNHMYGCHVSSNITGPYSVDDSTAYSTLVGCYSESGGPRSRLRGDRAVVLGGDHGAGFTDDTNALLLLTSRHMSPLRIIRKIHRNTEPFYTTEDVHHEIELGDSVSSRGDQLVLVAFFSRLEALEHVFRWIRLDPRHDKEKPIQRIRFDAKRSRSSPGMEWCQGELRGHGSFVFPKGFLLRIGGRGYSSERRVEGWRGASPAHGTYEKGDFILDLSGENYFFRPLQSFGSGQIWKPRTVYNIGDTVQPTTPNGNVYVVTAFRDGTEKTLRKKAGNSNETEPIWRDTGDIPDNEIVWKKWGPSWDSSKSDLIETFGRRTSTHTIEVGNIEPGTTWTNSSRIIISGARQGDTVVATPSNDLPPGIFWNALVQSNNRIRLRLTNAGSKSEFVDTMAWTIDCWKH